MAAGMEAAMKIAKLGEDNHLTWFADVEQVLKIKDCWEAVDTDPPAAIAEALAAEGGIPSKADLTLTLAAADTTATERTIIRGQLRALEWRRKDEVAKALMHLNVKPIHHATFRLASTGREVWVQLQQAFRSRGLARAMDMRRQLTGMRMEAGEGITEYINRGSMLCYEMRQLQQEPQEIDLVAALLSGLPAEYDTTVELLELLELTSLSGVTERLITAEVKHKRMARGTELEAAALAAVAAVVNVNPDEQPDAVSGGVYGDRRHCYGCGNVGHIRRDCPTNSYRRARDDGQYRGGADRRIHWSPPPRRNAGDHRHGNADRHRVPVHMQQGGRDGGAREYGQDVMGGRGNYDGDGGRGYLQERRVYYHDGRHEGGRRNPHPGRRAWSPAPPRPEAPGAGAQRGARDGPPAGGLAMATVGTAAVVTTGGHPVGDADWIIDSGASHHMTGNAGALINVRQTEPVLITIANGRTTLAVTAGEAVLSLDTDAGECNTTLHDVLLAPGLTVNLFSVKAITERGFGAYFSQGVVAVLANGGTVFHGRPQGHVYVLPVTPPHSTDDSGGQEVNKAVADTDGGEGIAVASVGVQRWHDRLAHPGTEAMLRTPAMVDGMAVAEAAPRAALKTICEPCIFGKQARGPFPSSPTKTTAAMDLLHMDLCGPMPVTSVGGGNYLLGVWDDYSGNAAAIPVPSKAHAGAAAAILAQEWRAATGRPLKMYRTDRGGEFVNKAMAKTAREQHVTHQTTAPYTPQQNGKAERFNRSLMEKVTAVMIASKCEKALWAEAAATVTYAMNRTARAGKTTTPHELWCGTRPSVAHMRTFGCAAYVLTPAKFRRKLDPRGRKGVFVGYEPGSKAYRVWVEGKIVISRDVVFDEAFMGEDVNTPADAATYDWTATFEDWGAPAPDDDRVGADGGSTAISPSPCTSGVAPVPALPLTQPAAADPPIDGSAAARPADVVDMTDVIAAARRASGCDAETTGGVGAPANLAPGMGGATHEGDPMATTRYPERRRDPPARLGEGSAHPSMGIELDPQDGLHVLTGAALAARMAAPNPDKMSLAQARLQPDWEDFNASTRKEVDALWDNGTFELVPRPPGARLLPMQMLCERKRGPTGEVTKHKSRGVVCGNLQVAGRDYADVWAPVVRKAKPLDLQDVHGRCCQPLDRGDWPDQRQAPADPLPTQ